MEVLRVSKLENLERLEHGPLSVGSLFKLREFSVRDCGKLLLCVFPSQLVPRLRNLEELTVERCNLLEVIFELEGVDSNEPNPELLSPLKVVKLRDLPKLNYISKRDPMDFKYIQTLVIEGCDSLRYVFAPTVAKSIPQLRELKIQRCKTLSRIVAEENGLGDSSVDGVEFPQLESLDLCELPNLVSFFPDVNATLAKSTDQLHNTMRPQPLFNEKVAFPRLEKLYLEGLPNLSDLWCSEVSLSNLEVLKVSKLENLERLGPLLVGTLFKLRRFLVSDCGKLLCVFPSQLVPRLRNLEELTVERCNLLEVVFELEGVDCNEPNTELLSPLKVVKLHDLPTLNYISKRDPMGFKYIQTLEIKGCDSLRYLFAPTVTKSISQLRELKIWRCKMLSRIVAEENGMGESLVDEVKFPQLESLELCNLPNFMSFFPNVNTTLPESTDHLHNPMQPQSLFNEKVVIPSLKYLKLLGLENVSDLWCSKLQRSSFSKLEKLEVSNCASLRNTFHPSMANCLVNLKELLIEGCSTLEAVVGKEEEVGGHERKIHKVEFPQLESLDLRDVPNLVSLFPNVNIGLPESADCLHNPMQPQSLFNEKVAIPSLKYLKLLGLKYVSDLWCSKLPSSSFSKLEKLTVGDCASLRNTFHPSMANCLVNLKELLIEGCSTLEAVVGKEEEVGGHERKIHKVEFPQLESLDLRDVPNLVSLFPNVNIGLPESADCLHNPMQPQSLFNEKVAIPSLKYLKLLGLKYVSDLWCSKLPSSSFSKLEKLTVGDCGSLRNIFHPSMAGGLVNVKELLIEDCSTLEAVVGKEEEVEGEHGIKIDKTLFPQLGKLDLHSLPNLRMFCHFAYPLELPLLSEMAILFCPSMDVFSLGRMSTPNLSLSSLRGYGDLINAKQLLRENGDDPMATSMEKPRTLDCVMDKSISWQVAETQCRLVAMPERIDGPHKVARLLYTNSGDGVLALGSNGSMKLWKWGSSKHNPSGKKRLLNSARLVSKATASVVPQQWQPASGLAMTNDVTGAKLEEAVPCIALTQSDSHLISACGGVISVFYMMTFKVIRTFMPPPPASTFLAIYPQDSTIIAIGMKDSTIHIYHANLFKVKSILEGHQKRITGLAFSTNLNILVSSGADAQCVSQDVLPAPISFAAYSCDSQLVYTSFCDGNIGVFDAENLTLRCCIAPSAYLSSTLLSGSQAVYPLVVAAHPQLPYQFAIGLTDGSVIVMEPPTITEEDGGTASSSNTSNQTPVQVQK
ncbi:hypothetical protein Vadar_008583 [Vaccinium darrowii]|uniref:Uncharacterized protein n=1 Tax=Vaccinium darrowii TaxID=229202 RepID=A0ACB7YLD3_9ERIC|nr:hypothetical protein Vadar_008583 [Vaccinium darrowii]